jgi:molybdate transport system substrate-binding protein
MKAILSPLLVLCLLWPASLGAEPALTVGAAISLREAMDEITAEYTRRTGRAVVLRYGSSGQLMAHVKAGAPIDLFIAAASRQADELIELGLADRASRSVVAGNRLVLVVPSRARSIPADWPDLAGPAVRRLVIGEPRSVPAGHYAAQALDRLELADAVRRKLIYGTNARQLLNYVERGEVDAAIVYHTDAIQAGTRVRIIARADPSLHDPIEYPAVIIKASRQAREAAEFLEYLRSEEARAILEARGFAVAPVTVPSK